MSEEVKNLDQEIVEDVSSEEVNYSDASSLSFDDLDEATSNEGEASFDTIAEGYVEKKAEENELPIEGESESEEIEASSEENEEEIEAESEEELQEEIKKILAKFNDEDLELAANTMFKHKVDGEEVDVELQELLNNYSGKVSYEKKFQELASTRKEFESYRDSYDKDIEDIYGVLENFKNSMQNKDALGALHHFAAFAGMSPYDFKQEMIRSLAPEVLRVNSLSEEQLLSEKLQAENAYLRQQQESEQARLQNQQTQAELVRQIRQIQEAHGISDDDFASSYNELKESGYDGNIDAQAVAVYHVNKMAFSKAGDVLNQVNPSLSNETEIVESLQKVIMENPQFDDNDLLEIVNEVYGEFKEETSKTLSKKAMPKKKENVETPKPKKEEFLDWDDL